MQNEILYERIINAKYYVDKYRQAEKNIEVFIRDIEELESLLELREQFIKKSNGGKVSKIRAEILDRIIKGEKLFESDIEKYIEKLKDERAYMWNKFSLMAGLYYVLFDVKKVEKNLEDLMDKILDECESLSEYSFKKTFDLQGARNTGATSIGFCRLKEEFNANEKEQIVVNIEDELMVFHYDSKNKIRTFVNKIDLLSKDIASDIELAINEIVKKIDNQLVQNQVSGKKNVWLGKVGNIEEFREMSKENIYRIYFTNMNVGNILQYKNIEEISKENPNFYTENGNLKLHSRNALWNISNEMKEGDELIVAIGSHKVLATAQINGDYFFDETTKTHNIPVIYKFKYNKEIKERFNRKTLTNITKYEEYVKNIYEQLETDNKKDNQEKINLDEFVLNTKNLIIDGAPGTGKSHYVKNNIITNDDEFERVTFYPDYEYHNFVGSILPSVNDGEITYKFQQGYFTQVLDKALCNPEYNYYLVIEELTRGNAAAIFGDVFQLLDRCENGWSEYSISNENMFESLDNLSKEVLLEKNNGNRMITMPPNMSIICTVNSSDQNVYPLDTAFKRRFNYKIMDVNEFNVANDFKFIIGNCTDENLGYEIKSWKEFYQTLNSYMIKQMGLKEDKQIGPYFIKESLSHEEKCSKLCLYLWNDVNKVYTSSPNKIFDTSKVSTLSELNNLFLNGSRSEIINVLADEFKEVLKINI